MKVATTKHSVLNRLDSILRFDIFTTFISHIGQKNRFESCSFLVHLAIFYVCFARKTRLSYTRKTNPTPNSTPEYAFIYREFHYAV